MQLDVVLRTHALGNVHNFGERYVGVPKEEVMLRCTNSLVRALNEVEGDIRLAVLDDRSGVAARARLRALLERLRHPWEMRTVEATVQNDSTLAQFALAREKVRDTVYIVEDDYLHAPTAIVEMCEAYALFKDKLSGHEIALHPYDDPNNYGAGEYQHEPCHVVVGPRRHWRTNTHTTNTVWLSRAMLEKHWDTFETLARGYGVDPRVGEHNTINTIWREDATLFTPIPSLALHMQYEQHKDPFINWQEWWDQAAT